MSVTETRQSLCQEEALDEFLSGQDFMKMGQAINNGRWDSAMMIHRRMDKAIKSLGIVAMEQSLKSLRAAIVGRNGMQAKQSLSILVAVRVRMLKRLESKTES